MARGLDHIVHAVRDLDAAAELYRHLGFQVGARNRHPWGTHNHVVQFPGFFIELLTLAEPDKLDSDGFAIDLPRGAIDVVTAAAFRRRFGQPAPDTARGPRLAALRFAGKALAADVKNARGAVLVFEAEVKG